MTKSKDRRTAVRRGTERLARLDIFGQLASTVRVKRYQLGRVITGIQLATNDRVASHNTRGANSIINSHRDVRKIRYSSPPIRKTWPAVVRSVFPSTLPPPRIIAIRLAALNRTELILTCNINRVLRLRASVIISFGADARVPELNHPRDFYEIFASLDVQCHLVSPRFIEKRKRNFLMIPILRMC